MKIEELENGKVYKIINNENIRNERFLYIGSFKQDDSHIPAISCINLSTMLTESFYVEVKMDLAKDQTHNITIDIKPNIETPRIGEVWENKKKHRILIVGKIIHDLEISYLCWNLEEDFSNCTYWLNRSEFIKKSEDQSHYIFLMGGAI